MNSVHNTLVAVTTNLGDHRANFEVLANTLGAKVRPQEAVRYIEGLKAIDTHDEGFYGPFCEAATIALRARLRVIEGLYAEHRAQWEKNLAELRQATDLTDEEITPNSGPGLLEALHALEQGKADGFKEDAFGDLTEEALRVQDAAIVRFRNALTKCALMVVDPDSVPADTEADSKSLEYALAMSRKLPLTLSAFNGDEEALAEAKRRHPIWIRKQEALLAKVKEREAKETIEQVKGAIDDRDELAHRNRVADASLTPEERTKRNQRAIEAAEPMYLNMRRLVEITKVQEPTPENPVGFGLLDAHGLMEVVQQAQVLVMRVEGRLQ